MLTFPNSGSGRPYISLDARTGMWKISTANGPEMVDLKGKTMALDVANAVQGWLHVGPSGADWQPIERGQWGNAPSADHKPGVALTVVIENEVRELRGNSKALTGFIAAIAREVGSQAAADGPLPLIRIEGSKVVKIGQGTSVDVQYKLAPAAKWVDRSVLHADGADPAPAPAKAAKAAPKAADDAPFDTGLEF